MELPSIITSASLVGNIVLIFYSFYAGFSQRKGALDHEVNELEKRLIAGFKERIDQLDGQVKRIPDLEQRIGVLENEKKLLTEVLNGRDPESQSYREQAVKAMQTTERMARVADRTEQNLKEVLKSINNLYVLINKHLENESKLIDRSL